MPAQKRSAIIVHVCCQLRTFASSNCLCTQHTLMVYALSFYFNSFAYFSTALTFLLSIDLLLFFALIPFVVCAKLTKAALFFYESLILNFFTFIFILYTHRLINWAFHSRLCSTIVALHLKIGWTNVDDAVVVVDIVVVVSSNKKSGEQNIKAQYCKVCVLKNPFCWCIVQQNACIMSP